MINRAVGILCILSALGPTGCRRAEHSSPETLYRSAYTQYLHGNLDAARSEARQARQAATAADIDWSVRFQLLEAEVLIKQNQLDAVVQLLGCDDTPAPMSEESAIRRELLCGLAHARLHGVATAARELASAHLLAESKHPALLADVLRTEGMIARDADQLDESTAKFKRSLTLARRGPDRLLETSDLIEIGFNNLQSAHFDEALSWFVQGAALARSIGARRQLEMAVGNVGWACQNLGDFNDALAHFQDAQQQALQIGMTNHRLVWLQDAGLAQYRLGNLREARQYDEEALRTAQSLAADSVVDQIANIEGNLALLLAEEGQYERARRYSEAAVMVSRKSKDNTVIAYVRYIQARLSRGEEARKILESAWQLAPDLDVRAEIESAMANSYADEKQIERASIWYRRSIETFENKRSTVGNVALRLSAFAYGGVIYRDYAEFLIKTNHPLEALTLLDRSRSRTLDEGLGSRSSSEPRDKDPRALAGRLNASILFYSLGREQSRLWVVTANQTQLFTLPGERQIQSIVRKHQSDIQQALDPDTAAYDTLVKPAANMIAAGSKVYVVADGVLHGLNFETLQAGGRRYWIEDVALTTASSIRMLARSAAAAPGPTTKELLLIGDPTLPKESFAPLPDAAREIQQVRQHFAPDREMVISQDRAIPAAYGASHPEDFRYIHFATHGTSSPSSPLDSAVVLSPPPQEPEAFKLYARDIVQHPLNAELVTISACYGSGVRTYAGEGLVGLAWVFLRAGAHNVIAALWQVADAASPLLMEQLYNELQAGKAPDEALRAAKLSLLHSSRIYRKPLFWGAFQLYAGS